MRITIESTIAFLYSNPPSSLKILLKKFILGDKKGKKNYESYDHRMFIFIKLKKKKKKWKHWQCSVLKGELQTQGSNGIHHNDFELISNIRHEVCNLLHQTINTWFIPCFQQCCNGKCSNASILIRNQTLHIYVTVSYCHWVTHCHLSKLNIHIKRNQQIFHYQVSWFFSWKVIKKWPCLRCEQQQTEEQA